MPAEIPIQFDYDEYVTISNKEVHGILARDMLRNPRWRADSAERIHGGSRRTFLPNPQHLSDRILFGGGSTAFKRIMEASIQAANRLMSEIVTDKHWAANRVVVNHMPPSETLTEHIDPEHFEEGAVVIGAGAARLYYRMNRAPHIIHNPPESIVYIPSGVPHWVENMDDERFSIVLVQDAQLNAGVSTIRQRLLG